MRLILASSSPRRRELVASLGLTFDICKPDIDETRRPSEPPLQYVARISREKAQAITQTLATPTEPTFVLAADTMVLAADTIGIEKDGRILGKPEHPLEAREMLQRLRHTVHEVCTHIQLYYLSTGESDPQNVRVFERLTRTQVTMRNYTDAEIDAYISTGDPFDKAGGYAIQHAGFAPVARIDGCYHNVVGLPLCEVKRGLARLGTGVGHLVPAPEGACDCPPYRTGV